MQKNKVFDSSALLAYFQGQEAGKQVMAFLQEAAEQKQDLLISTVNWGEILYVVEARLGPSKRDEVEHLMEQMHLEMIEADKDLCREAAHLKATRKLPYADCFAAALAKTRKAILLTTDKDFKVVENEITVNWL